MNAVEICLQPGDLPEQMGAMRTWLDQHRFEPSSFSCRKRGDRMVVVSVVFRAAPEASAFADRFGGQAGDSHPAR
jgi:hypothetical protein